MTKPTILFVPGSFAPPTIYASTIAHLRSTGFPCVALSLPSTTKRHPLRPATMSDDASVIRRAAETLIAQGKDVVVACHSYGGTPTSQGLAGLAIKKIVYITAIVPRIGQNQNMAMGMEGEGEDMPIESVEGYMHIDPVAMAAAVCNDLPWDLAYENTLNFKHHSTASFLEKVSQAAYSTVPSSYVLCEEDLVVSPEKQGGFVKVLEEAGREVRVVRLKSGHCPNWSMSERLAEVVGELAMEG